MKTAALLVLMLLLAACGERPIEPTREARAYWLDEAPEMDGIDGDLAIVLKDGEAEVWAYRSGRGWFQPPPNPALLGPPDDGDLTIVPPLEPPPDRPWLDNNRKIPI